ncbi:glycosyltransferase family 4 protein [Paenibacillus glycanilyticus]|uniref:Glycosyl transferase n=1 Tax=Paenibacillus glycanilyticus TaxID=126569 RepID=A0ABQ6G9V6_9BACL|nr:glycosyltransferase family 4 protein [Paenibacillus glycanilyticus]GLX66351.1 glycosyl transferase [Paenibacillus glycanilyticus]
MRIVQIITRSDSIGGAQIHVRDLCVELLKRGHDVHLLAGGNGHFLTEAEALGIRTQPLKHLIRSIRPHSDAMALLEMVAVLRKLKPDLVATHSSKAGWLGRLAAKLTGIPCVFTAHGWAFTEGVSERKRMVYKWAEKAAGKLASKIITVSHYDFNLCVRDGVIPVNKATTVHNGIPDIQPIRRTEGESSPRLIMVARLDEPKNHRFLIEALSGLADERWELDIVGDGPLREAISKQVVDLNLTSRIRLLGERKDVHQLLAESDIFILISDWEGLPLSILEAMRAGLPVIASKVGGVPETVIEGCNGFLTDKGNVEQLRLQLLHLLQRPELRREMGKASRELYEQKFEISKMIDSNMAIYRDAITLHKNRVKKRLSEA